MYPFLFQKLPLQLFPLEYFLFGLNPQNFYPPPEISNPENESFHFVNIFSEATFIVNCVDPKNNKFLLCDCTAYFTNSQDWFQHDALGQTSCRSSKNKYKENTNIDKSQLNLSTQIILQGLSKITKDENKHLDFRTMYLWKS